MAQFTFFKISGRTAISSFDIEDFDTAEQAKRHAAALLNRSAYEAIEVCQGDDCSLVKREHTGESSGLIQ